MTRVKNAETIRQAVGDYCAFDIEEWVNNPRNIALGEDNDLALFEYEKEGVYTGHYFFNRRKGREAIKLSKAILQELFTNEQFNIKIIRGLTPLENLKARWMSRHVGFKSYGAIQTLLGPCELFILTKDEWQNG